MTSDDEHPVSDHHTIGREYRVIHTTHMTPEGEVFHFYEIRSVIYFPPDIWPRPVVEFSDPDAGDDEWPFTATFDRAVEPGLVAGHITTHVADIMQALQKPFLEREDVDTPQEADDAKLGRDPH
jgi:hypothetical protein